MSGVDRAVLRSGVLVVDKVAGVTSFDVVAAARRRLGARRVGHAGTLDPDGTGVLPLLIGEATKLMVYLADQDKEYQVVVRLGVATDTHDAAGRVVATAPVPALSRADVEQACRRFVGRIQQVPPMYSALHHQGRRLYELAREGVEVERAPREVTVHAITVDAVELPTVTLSVTCGKGTYVRTLVSDLGAVLGCGAMVERLVRLRVGPFRREDAVSWASLAALTREELWTRVLPPEAALAGWAEARLDAHATATFLNGQPARPRSVPGVAGLVRVHDASGAFLGVGEAVARGVLVKPVRILHADRPGSRVLPA